MKYTIPIDKDLTERMFNSMRPFTQEPTEMIYTTLSEWRTESVTHIPWNVMASVVWKYTHSLRRRYAWFVAGAFVLGIVLTLILT